ncbi:MAG: flagellar basal body L-ring protein FlgH, partial [Planctomycetes bacterium]|nr:flagellar basal body L-ring protein FlgH [Planctomycetota bacterium]
FQVGRSVRLFEDNKAFRIGDLLSITLSESTNASKSAATNTGKDDEIGIGAAALLGAVPSYNGDPFLTNTLTAERGFSGSGDSAQSNSLDGEITVMVSDILPNGTLVIHGEKIIGLNQGAEYIRISGLVRPQDVSSDNVVFSQKLANARIYYGGGGVIAEANTKGWLSRMFDSPLFPF